MARYGGMVRGVVASFRLQEADAADAVQMTWLRAFERLDSVRNPDRLGGWLATIANRECLALLRQARWETPDEAAGRGLPGRRAGPGGVGAGRGGQGGGAGRRGRAAATAASSWCTRCSTGRNGTTSAWPTSSVCRSAASGRPAAGCCARCAAPWSRPGSGRRWRSSRGRPAAARHRLLTGAAPGGRTADRAEGCEQHLPPRGRIVADDSTPGSGGSGAGPFFDFIAQLRRMADQLDMTKSLGSAAGGARLAMPMLPPPGALSAAQLSAMTSAVAAQRGSIDGLVGPAAGLRRAAGGAGADPRPAGRVEPHLGRPGAHHDAARCRARPEARQRRVSLSGRSSRRPSAATPR